MKKHIFLIGMPGSGKSSLALALSKKYQLPMIDTDARIEQAQCKSISAIWQESGEIQFRALERKYLLALMEENPSVVATGGGLPCWFDNLHWMKKRGHSVYLFQAPENLVNFLKHGSRPLFQNELPSISQITELYLQRHPIYNRADIVLEAIDQSKLLNLFEYHFLM
ncbi:MAG: shikimate kinase [Saprospiraceae bacterium]|nr:shikimate kinase [Saprospiraceae bacterium]